MSHSRALLCTLGLTLGVVCTLHPHTLAAQDSVTTCAAHDAPASCAAHDSASSGTARDSLPPPAAQNPSPMVEHTRAHRRIAQRELPGIRRSVRGPLGKPVELFIPEGTSDAGALKLVLFFHGSPFIPEYSVARLGNDHIVAVVHLGAGSTLYDQAFSEPAVYDSLLAQLQREAGAAMVADGDGKDEKPARFRSVTLVGFSAGHGAVRAILRDPRHFAQVDAVLLLDGIHTGYIPHRVVLAKGGKLDGSKLETLLRFSRAAIRGEKRFMITHSEIFPGTFASTTETTDYLIEQLGLTRTPVLRWGPGGMQQLSEAREGSLAILGFAGNSAPDHIDHIQGMPDFLRMLEEL